ncbi:MAG TPA: DUF6285 domain-containing protein, partial [Mycobacterium sp.]|nr:DUF6285 domain-containing protein [Mycobacterium sp.]
LLVASTDNITEALARLHFDDEAQLAAAIRAGDLGNDAKKVMSCLKTLVRHRLAGSYGGRVGLIVD